MFDKIIEFSTNEKYYTLKEDYPTPIKLNIPEWYKKLTHTMDVPTVKGCMPFLDTLTTGYLLKIPQDLHIKHNVYDTETNKQEAYQRASIPPNSGVAESGINLNINTQLQTHPPEQLGNKCPLNDKNKNMPFHKILNPWTITTPKGYSCLFVSPLNNADDRFSIIPGIVDTDSYKNEINFPIIINGDKYSELDTTLTKGTPYVQVIPFKRDNWKMEIKVKKNNKIIQNRFSYNLKLLHKYKLKYWQRKSWK
jgi:hypothetical protein